MQLYALAGKELVFAPDALKQKAYLCPGCGEIVHLRGGDFRQKHFYHIRKTPLCRESNKSLTHLELQKHLLRLLPEGDSQMEKPFSSINRIADVFWISQKIVFEIQCSPISRQEARQRCEDYASLGLKVVWLLSDRLFNKRRMKESEALLRKKLAYFFFYQREKGFLIYDQWEITRGLFRSFLGTKFPILLDQPKPAPQTPEKEKLPQIAAIRLLPGIYFKGDLLDRILASPASYLASYLNELEKKTSGELQRKKGWRSILKGLCQKPLFSLWEMLLRSSSNSWISS